MDRPHGILPVVVAALAMALAIAPAAARDVHVDATAGDDAREGASWLEAVRTIDRALVLAAATAEADTIHVAAGSYAENVLIDQSGVTLLGGWPAGGAGPRDPAANPTVIDGGGVGPALTISGSDGAVVLDAITVDGFELTNGRAFERGVAVGGAGAFVEEAAVVLTNNVLRGNVADAPGSKGGGLYLFRQDAGPSLIRANRFEGNTAVNGLGGGAWLADFGDPAAQGPLTFSANTLVGNVARADADLDPAARGEPNGNGGGLFAWGGATVIADNTFEGNVAESLVDDPFNGQGGGLFVLSGAPVLTGNTIDQNVARAERASYGAAGGGAYLLTSDARVENNTFRQNSALGADGDNQAWGGGLNVTLLEGAAPRLTGNVLEGNEALGGLPGSARGGGLYVFIAPGSGGAVTVRDGTFTANRAEAAGGGLWLFSEDAADLVVEEAEVTANEADFASGVMALGSVEIRHARMRWNAVYDPDGDEVSEIQDNCPGLANGVQSDADGDGAGDACDDDDDDDGEPDASDNCPLVANAGQADGDGDGVGDACQGDADGDTIADAGDNCPLVANQDQGDATMDGVGDACEPARFDPLETNASGIWVAGDSILTNVEITDNVGQGIEIIGFAEDPDAGMPEDQASPVITNATITRNLAAGFVTYLASGTTWRDSIIAGNVLSDGFDTLDGSGNPSTTSLACESVNFGDGVPSTCAGSGNISDTPCLDPLWIGLFRPCFAAGPLGDYYLSQTAAGQAQQDPSVDAGSRPASASPVANRTTRTDEAADEGTVDLGYHYGRAPAPPDELGAAVRVQSVGGDVELSLQGAPADLTAIRVFRGELDALPVEYSHRAPFSGLPGDPECSVAADATFRDTSAVGDGRNWYYLAVRLTAGSEGDFGRDAVGQPRPRPEDAAGDRVVSACP